MRLTAVGTSGSFPGPAAAASCYLVEVDIDRGNGSGTFRVVLDLGSGALGALQQHVSPARIDAVVLSHLHPDHCLDVTGLYVHRVYDPEHFCSAAGDADGAADGDAADERPLLPIYGPAGAKRRLEAAHHTEPGLSPQAQDAAPTDLGQAFDFVDLTPGATLALGPLTLETFLVDHPVEAYALRLTGPDGAVLTYSGDSDVCESLVDAARGSDAFLCEAAFQEDRDTVRGIHLTGLRAGRTARTAGTASLILTHIPPWTDADVVRAEAAGEYPGPLMLAEPGAAWTIVPGHGAQTDTGRPHTDEASTDQPNTDRTSTDDAEEQR